MAHQHLSNNRVVHHQHRSGQRSGNHIVGPVQRSMTTTSSHLGSKAGPINAPSSHMSMQHKVMIKLKERNKVEQARLIREEP